VIAKHILIMLVLAAYGTGTWAQATTSPASSPVSQSGTISCKNPVFTLDVPAGFRQIDLPGDNVLYTLSYAKDKRIYLRLSRWDESSRKLTDTSFGYPIDRTSTLTWQGKDVYVYQVTLPHRPGEAEEVTLNAAIQTDHKGVMVTLIGPKQALPTMETLLPQALAGLHAPQKSTSGWLDSTKATLLLILGMAIVIFTLRRHQIVKKRQHEQDEARRKAAWGDGPAL